MAVSQCGSMLRSALIGCFKVQLISVAHTAGRKHRENIYFNTLLKLLWNAQSLFSFPFYVTFKTHAKLLECNLCIQVGFEKIVTTIIKILLIKATAKFIHINVMSNVIWCNHEAKMYDIFSVQLV